MKISATFTAKLEKSDKKGGWTYVIWPQSKEFFGTGGAVKVGGTINGQPFQTSFMAMGNGKQMLPIKSEIRAQISKEAGDEVNVILSEKFD